MKGCDYVHCAMSMDENAALWRFIPGTGFRRVAAMQDQQPPVAAVKPTFRVSQPCASCGRYPGVDYNMLWDQCENAAPRVYGMELTPVVAPEVIEATPESDYSYFARRMREILERGE